MRLIGEALSWLLSAYLWVLIIRALVSWLPLLIPGFRPRGAVAIVLGWLGRLTDPPLRWLRRFVRPIGAGAVSLDLSFIVLFVLVLIAQRMVVIVFF
ncbi:MAG: YggT family protein [Propionibacteriaceae bacterium]|nr:YggT family protein [Propionibacteriaceae bacterium]